MRRSLMVLMLSLTFLGGSASFALAGPYGDC
jgi:hypothetical protein